MKYAYPILAALVLTPASLLAPLTGPASAVTAIVDYPKACPGRNCGSQTIRGQYRRTEPFVIQVFAIQGNCLRLDVTTQSSDMSMRVIGPYLIFDRWFNDDYPNQAELMKPLPDDQRPRIVVDPVPRTGFYTVLLNFFNGLGPGGSFTLRYGIYNTGNVNNCSDPTAISSQPVSDVKEAGVKLPE